MTFFGVLLLNLPQEVLLQVVEVLQVCFAGQLI